ncbi:DUF4139 domain-containing protein [Mycolicibacterium goodii]|uniref:DUF4139 domain-containing protein n=1 Tax=Mycolicibacterium goodii TaxID=134601 RepID=UPI001BDD5793|nr:DUF4139 domain-containing protein [Mycolicibacterium goodii]MBU8812661.1 DUF4139 domain-containing protein [Mycolicibacterium goodii]
MGRHHASHDRPAAPTLPVTRTQIRHIALAMVALAVGVLAMIASYSGAFAKPALHHMSIAVVAPTQLVDQLREQDSLAVHEVADDAAARAKVLERTADAALVVGSPDRLDIYVAGGGGRSVAGAAESVGRAAAAQAGLVPAVTDIAPTSPGNPQGTVEFYAIIFISLGASVGAAAFGHLAGPVRRPMTLALRTATLAGYSVLLAGMVTIYVDAVLGALVGHPWQVFGVLWLYCMAVGGAVTGVAAAFGSVASMALTAFLVIVGNAAAAGPVGRPLLSNFYATFNLIVPQGSGVSLLRSVEYFGRNGAVLPFATLAVWAAAGCLLAVLGTVARSPRIRNSARRAAERRASGGVLNYRFPSDGNRSERAVLPAGVLSPGD